MVLLSTTTSNRSIQNRGDTLFPVPLRRTHDDNAVLDGEGVHVVDHHVVGGGQERWLACERSILVQNDLENSM